MNTNPLTTIETLPENAIHAITVDNLIFGYDDGVLKVFLCKTEKKSTTEVWGLPGGDMKRDESLEQAAHRTLIEQAGISNVFLEQLHTFSAVNRYPFERIITTAFYSLVRPDHYKLALAATELEAQWCSIKALPELIFDHRDIVETGIRHLKHKVRHEPIGFNLLPEKFSLLDLQRLYEAVLDIKLDKPNFRRKMTKMNLLISCNEKQQGVAHRAANLYKFDIEVYKGLSEQGFVFEV